MPHITILYTAEQIQKAVREVAQQIRARFGDKEPVMVLCLLNGSIWYAANLLRALPSNFILHTVKVSSYAGTCSTGQLHWHTPLPDCVGKRVLVLDDMLDTGLTMKSVCEELLQHGAAEVVSTVAIDKQGRRAVDFHADYCALTCGNHYLVGYGMDYNGLYRNLPYIGSISED